MFTPFKFFVVFITAFSLNLGVMDFAEAKRLGGGSSFGSKFSHNKSVKKNNTAQREQAAAPSKAQTTNQARKKELASKGGLMGILGGLAIGGILGALFFGGAFEGINFFDILIIALIAFLAYKLLFSKRKAQDGLTPATAGGGTYQDQDDMNSQQYRTTQNDAFGSDPQTSSSAPQASYSHATGLDELRNPIPKHFDQETFLNGAKSCFARLQKAWDEGDLADIRQFTTDSVFAEVQDQHRAKTNTSKTEIIALNAELLKVEELGSRSEATVFFEAHLREDGQEGHISELWHFTKPNTSLQPIWFVDGIQQVED